MKRFVFPLLASVALVSAEPALPLPTWKPGEKKTFEEAGGIIQSFILADEPEPEPPPLEVEKPKAEEVTPEPVRTDEIPEQFLLEYFAQKPKDFLVDPQGLLPEKDYKDRLNFLKYHADDSSIDFFVYIFGSEQEIPGEVRAEETMERLFMTGKPAVVVFYFLGQPQRSVIHLSPSLMEGVSSAEQRRALQSSVMSAFGKLNETDQLEAFSVQMSIRVYWMERMLGGGTMMDRLPTAAEPHPVHAVKKEASLMDRWRAVSEKWFSEWWGVVSLASGSMLLLSAFVAWMRARVRLRFPEFDVEPRLDGSHGAGVGAVISFASAAVPPASQKDQVPDYLRRA